MENVGIQELKGRLVPISPRRETTLPLELGERMWKAVRQAGLATWPKK